MTELEQKIHDVVEGGPHPMNSNQILQSLKDHYKMDVTIEKVREAIENLLGTGFLKDANLPSYYALF